MSIRLHIPAAIAVALLSSVTCARARTPQLELEASAAPVTEAAPPAKTVSEPVRYCDVYPQFCRPCPGKPGSCGGEPMAGGCCCEGGGCVGVGLAGDCDPACDFLPCEWGYQTEDASGTPEFWCYDGD
jgi:hypothetical protein